MRRRRRRFRERRAWQRSRAARSKVRRPLFQSTTTVKSLFTAKSTGLLIRQNRSSWALFLSLSLKLDCSLVTEIGNTGPEVGR